MHPGHTNWTRLQELLLSQHALPTPNLSALSSESACLRYLKTKCTSPPRSWFPARRNARRHMPSWLCRGFQLAKLAELV
eukprot:6173652-Pleurochrysis_carterae.AAC.5